ncbi:MAG: hypothetical protein QOD41_1138 [Cryptosporangiaceae bacterium]|nr:hypothetical protein [Cryptosporangiaceae bacterium]
MRLPITMTIFAVGAAVGTAIVAGPRLLDSREANPGADRLTAGSPAPPRQSAGVPDSPPPIRPSGTPSPSETGPAGEQSGAALPDAATVVLRNKVSRECLDSNPAGEVYMLPCNGGQFQLWNIKDNKDGTRAFKDTATGRCLENRERGDSTPVFTGACDGNKFQKWYFITEPSLVSLQNDTTRLCLWDAPRPASSVRCEGSRDELWWEVAITARAGTPA